MKIWLLNNYNMLPEHGALNRSYCFGKYLSRMGHRPVAFVGSHPHNTTLQLIDGSTRFQLCQQCSFPWVLVKTCNYEGSKLKRIWSMFEYYYNVKKAVKHFEQPNAIIGSSAHPLAALAAIQLGKKYGCKAIVEIRDLWPESLVAHGILSRSNPLIHMLYYFEKWLYAHADAIVFTMEGGKDYIIEHGWDTAHGGSVDIAKVHHINNGVDLEAFEYNKEHCTFEDADLDALDTFKVVYTGSIRLVNQIDRMVDVAKILREKHVDKVKILLWGAGDQCESIQKRIDAEQLTNIVLKGVTSKENVPYVLSKSDLNVYLLGDTPLYRFGLSLNKSFEYFASGKPVLASANSGYSIIDRYQCGVCLDDFTPETMADAIIRMSTLSKADYAAYCRNALRAAQDYDFKVLTEKLASVIERI